MEGKDRQRGGKRQIKAKEMYHKRESTAFSRKKKKKKLEMSITLLQPIWHAKVRKREVFGSKIINLLCG